MTRHPRRWAVARTRPNGFDWLPTVVSTHWLHATANRTARHHTRTTGDGPYVVLASDGAPYRERRHDIVTALADGPRSTAGITARTALSLNAVRDTLLRMAREDTVVHVVPYGHDSPDRGVWRYRSKHQQHT